MAVYDVDGNNLFDYSNAFIDSISDTVQNILWQIGTETVSFVESTTRIGTGVPYSVDYDLHLVANENYRLSVLEVISPETPLLVTDLILSSGWVSDFYIRAGTIFYFQIRNANNSEIAPSEFSNAFSSNISSKKLSNIIDLLIFAGQSNMAGRGITNAQWPETAPVTIPSAGYEFRAISNPLYLVPVSEPFGVNENNPNGINDGSMKTGSMVAAFTNAYYTNNGNVPIVAVSASKGGSGIDEWQPNTPYLTDAIARLNSAKQFLISRGYAIRHIFLVWCQGEHEAGTSSTTDDENYISDFLTMFAQFQNNGIEKCMLCRIGEYNGSGSDFSIMIQKQTELAKTTKDVIMATATLASFKLRGLMKDELHFYQAGYNEMGKYAGVNAAYYTVTGKEPTMYDPKNDNLYYSEKN